MGDGAKPATSPVTMPIQDGATAALEVGLPELAKR